MARVTHAQNIRRQPKLPSTGVASRGEKFISQIKVNGDVKYLGIHKTFDLALLARIIGEIRYWGEPTQQMP